MQDHIRPRKQGTTILWICLLVPHRWNRRGLEVCTLSVCPSVCPSVRHIGFPDFSSPCFLISEWKLVASIYMKSYRSSSTFITYFFRSYCPLFKISFSGLFFTLLSHIWMKFGRMFPYEELQIKFDFRHGWLTFSWVIALYLQLVFQTFLGYDLVILNESWYPAF